ncbi:MAG TPA: hypothetical protein VF789_28975 [Thermoanaerobaculia bacterium]
MDTQAVALVAVAIFALIVIFLAVRFRGGIKAGIKGPGGTSLDVEASNPQASTSPGVKIEGAKSRAGSLQASDHTGRGADVKDVDTYGDIQVTSDPHPKAEPPA